MNQDDHLHAMRHSLAHIMAAAIMHIWPDAKLGVGPVIENGFYYDIDLGKQTISDVDFSKIEKEMRKIISEDQPFKQSHKGIEEAIDWAKDTHQPYKEELLNDLKRSGTTAAKDIDATELGLPSDSESKVQEVSFYTNGDFTDLCRGPHVESTGKVGAFKLMKVSGAYWRGSEKNPQMQRIYGVAFDTEEDLKKYLDLLEEAKKRDHRIIGKDLKIFMFSDLVGSGLPLWMPAGEKTRHTLIEYMRQKDIEKGYQYVVSPVLAHEELYKRSGHAQYYADDMYSLEDNEGNKFYIKAMSCPHHHMIYEQLVQSYRDLPLALAEPGTVYRNELSGTLNGLIRVRGAITQNDAHIYVEPKDVRKEFVKVLSLFEEVYRETGIKDYWYRLSLPNFDKDKYGGDRKIWDEAGQAIRDALVDVGAKFVEAEGEAAFYGPKLDVQVRNVLGKEDSISTNQVDILVPQRMGLKYVDSEGKTQAPIVIHRAILGSFERFTAFLLEQTAGHLPLWLAPEQVRVLTVNERVHEYVQSVKSVLQEVVLNKPLKYNPLRYTLDERNESLGKKIHEALDMKIPVVIVVGPQDEEKGEVVVRHDNKEVSVKLDSLKSYLEALS
ncbi:MAG TPA: threonine--tRNA ligase [Candidatus Saccharimonadales bacterium]|nr:threonine--tRNA ligase [Candidatus Saccharimonadales bacterium]